MIVASGDLDEHRIARLVAAGAPIDMWGVGTELGVSREAPTLGGVYKLVADRAPGADWRPVSKRSPAKQTLPGAKQVFRTVREGVMNGARENEYDVDPEEWRKQFWGAGAGDKTDAKPKGDGAHSDGWAEPDMGVLRLRRPREVRRALELLAGAPGGGRT